MLSCHAKIGFNRLNMNRRIIIVFSVIILSNNNVYSQIDTKETYKQFRQQVIGKYNDFRNEVNRKYADFLRNVWEEYKKKPAIPKPKDEDLPPVVIPEDDRKKAIKNNPIVIKDVVTPPEPQPQPQPIAPIKENQQPQEKIVTFMFYETECKIRFPQHGTFVLQTCDKNILADAWEKLSEVDYDNVIRDCLILREQHKLCDWAYLNMLKTMSETCFGKTNEATMLAAYIYCQSGYDMRIGVNDGKVYLLYASRHVIYDMEYYSINGKYYYPLEKSNGNMFICDVSYPEEKPLDLSMSRAMSLAYASTDEKTIQSERYPEMKAVIGINKNLIDFYSTYPSSMIDNDFMTCWAIYANTPMDEDTKNKLYVNIKSLLEGLNAKEAVERLLNFVQTGFVYEYDDKVWGCDRAFFSEETLYYPYCDCEDRSILFSRLVRDILGLKVILVYYPGHLATAVRFEDGVNGDHIAIGNDKYTICDPTYIGAPIGMTMPGMDNQAARVIILK